MQVDRIVNELELSDANAERFTALYGQYTAEMHEAARKHARIHPEKDESGKPKRLSDEQIKHNIEAQFALSQATLDIRRKYYKEYLKFLTPRQIEHLSRIEKKQAEKFHKSFGQRKGQARPVKPTAHQAFQGRPGRFQGHRAAAPSPYRLHRRRKRPSSPYTGLRPDRPGKYKSADRNYCRRTCRFLRRTKTEPSCPAHLQCG